jgi:hypothetical protein
MTFQLFTPATSESDLRATILGLKLSKILTRRLSEPGAALQTALAEIETSGLFRILYIEVNFPGESPLQAAFGALSSDEARLIQASYRNRIVTVCIMAEPAIESGFESLELFLDYAAQQIGLSAARAAIRSENQILDAELRISRESLTLGKLMARATALISARGLTTQQAQDFLVATSVRTGKPLVTVAEELLLAVSLPITNHGKRRPAPARPGWAA